jgi:hypothetical protein
LESKYLRRGIVLVDSRAYGYKTCCEFEVKITPMKTKICGAKESSNQNQLRSNLGIKVKSTKPQAKDKEIRETNTPNIVDPVRSIMTYYGGEIDLSNPLSMNSYKDIQKGYKKLASTSS